MANPLIYNIMVGIITNGGFKMSKENNQAKKPFWKKWWFWAIVVVLLIGGIASVGEDSGDVSVNTNQSEPIADNTESTQMEDEKDTSA